MMTHNPPPQPMQGAHAQKAARPTATEAGLYNPDTVLHLFDIERFAIHDGPGIRTTVFLQGCPLRCPWCANPESQHICRHLLFFENRCVGCGTCAAVCPQKAIRMQEGRPVINRAKCVTCGICADHCPQEALRISGATKSAAEIIRLALRDTHYYNQSGGGVTISGGEPFVQAEGLISLLAGLKQAGLRTAVETTGQGDARAFRQAAPLIDLFLFDLKHADAATLLQVTRGNLALILENLQTACTLGAGRVILRVPVIPGFNRDEVSMRGIFDTALRFGVQDVHLLPYHTLGAAKYGRLGLEYALGELTMLHKEDLADLQKLGRDMGLMIQLGG